MQRLTGECWQMDRSQIKYRNLDVISLRNEWLDLIIAPQLGGRLLQWEMSGHAFFFVNKDLERIVSEEGWDTQDGWLNFGGEKIWPAPQGWDSPAQWPGPPDSILDSGPFTVLKQENDSEVWQLAMRSDFDPYTGLVIEKRVRMMDDRAEVKVMGLFHNNSQRAISWSVWPVCQMRASSGDSCLYRIFCPANKQSRFEGGFKTLHGLVNNPQYNRDSYGHVVVCYQYLVGKIGMDSDAGWVAYLEYESGKAFVVLFPYQKKKVYPEETTVQIWTQGKGSIYSRKKIISYPDDTEKNPPYIEIELLSPLETIDPGDSLSFTYRLLSTTIPPKAEIQSVSEQAIIARRLNIEVTTDNVVIRGKFGFFIKGMVMLCMKEELTSTSRKRKILHTYPVSPIEGLSLEWHSSRSLWAEYSPFSITVDLYDEKEHFISEIDQIEEFIIKP